VEVAAPASPQSAAGHGITVHGPIAVERVHVNEAFYGFAVDGRPADCGKLAVSALLDHPPDLIVSGINDGANAGVNVLYSGTVAAAAEGALLGFPAVAVSLKRGPARDFLQAARITVPIIRALLEDGLPPGRLVNINIPDLTDGPPRGIRFAPQATRTTHDRYARHRAPDGRDYFWMLEVDDHDRHDPADSDVDALHERYVAVTPLQFDLTQHELLAGLRERSWELE
jgi:5'-nucleotidase